MSPPVVEAVVFDINETLFSLDRLRPAFGDAGLDPGLVPAWFAALLREGFALAALGGFRPLPKSRPRPCGGSTSASMTPRWPWSSRRGGSRPAGRGGRETGLPGCYQTSPSRQSQASIPVTRMRRLPGTARTNVRSSS